MDTFQEIATCRRELADYLDTLDDAAWETSSLCAGWKVKDVAAHVELWLDQLRIDPDNEVIGTLLSKLQLVHPKELKELSALGAGYAALFLTEGTGLLFRKRWAEWLTIVATSSLMPIEVYELLKEFTAVRLVALLVNAVVVLYLIYLVRQKEA